jgi:hypothetical protein
MYDGWQRYTCHSQRQIPKVMQLSQNVSLLRVIPRKSCPGEEEVAFGIDIQVLSIIAKMIVASQRRVLYLVELEPIRENPA